MPDGGACIRFPVTTAIYNRFAEDNADLFEMVSGDRHFLLYCFPEDYKPVIQELGTTEISMGYNSAVIVPAATLYGFEVTTVESRPAAYYVLDTLRKNAQLVPGEYEPIAVLDGHHVHDGAVVTIDGVPYTQRSMRMQSLQPQGGSIVVRGERWAASGFTVRLMEVAPRDIY